MLADSHIHLFEKGYKNSGENEVALYENLIEEYSIGPALVVGYEGESWAVGNNVYIASLAPTRSWLHPLAFVRPKTLSVTQLENLLSLGFEGISLYLFSEEDVTELRLVAEGVWQWLVDHCWMVSVNSKSHYWEVWLQILTRFPTLTLLISHLGLPTVSFDTATQEKLNHQFSSIEKLHKFVNVYLKLSGLYALEPTKPTYPYRTLDRYLKYILENFEVKRLIWGSDFTPALSLVTFPQAFQHFSDLPFMTSQNVSKILNQNLVKLLS
jgi:predicted TIM-barrel fold metal-dependent hydrolase